MQMPWTRTRAYPVSILATLIIPDRQHAFGAKDHKSGGGYNYMVSRLC